ncbi:MAG: branched-chain amino acid ABC transporter permease [Actinophytocola sp.]|nr:branched-chain amino acid ABC transporter permease [Actinophytocola sp.]
MLSGASMAHAQEGETVEGRVTDTSGRGVPGVTVDVVAEGGGVKVPATTDDSGSFTATVPEPGQYRVTIDPQNVPEGSDLPPRVAGEGVAVEVTAGEPASVEINLRLQEALTGTLIDSADKPVEGATISVSSADGEFAQDAVTDAKGGWAVFLPGPGEYSVTLQTDTLPEGIEPREDSSTELTGVVVDTEAQRPVLFPLGERAGGVGGKLGQALQLTAEGLRFGLLLALAAMGLSLVFGTSGLVNFAHGELIAMGAAITWGLNVAGVNLILAGLISIVALALFGGLQDLAIWRPLRRRKTGLIAMMIVTIGLALFVRSLIQYFMGPSSEQYREYVGQAGLHLGLVRLTTVDLVSMLLAAIVLVGVSLMLIYTRMGKATRAVADNPALAESSGIDVQRVILLVWIMGSFLAGLSGTLFGFSEGIKFDMGQHILLLVFAGVILGGLGTAFGALVGSLIVGVFINVSTLWIPPELKNVGALAILIVILLFRPRGILGRRERVG